MRRCQGWCGLACRVRRFGAALALALLVAGFGCARPSPNTPPSTPPAASPEAAAPVAPPDVPAPAPAVATEPEPSPIPAVVPDVPRAQVRSTTIKELQEDLIAATRSPGVERGTWGIVVHSLDRDQPLFELNSRALLVPASVAKIVSAVTAADAVGWDFRYETALRATGPVVNGVLRGDLVVVGSGDPTIGGRGDDDLGEWASALRAAGIRRIDGRVIGDDDAIEEPRPQLAWTWDDLGYTSGALFGALNVNENRSTITVTPGPVGGPAVLSLPPLFSYRQVVNRVTTGPAGSAQLLWPEQRPGEEGLTIAGSIPAGAPSVVLGVAVGNPTLHAAQVLRARLVEAGIRVRGGAFDVDDAMPPPERTAGTTIHVHRSRPLFEIVRPMLKESINVYAEAAMRLNAAPGAFPTNDAALDGLRRRLESWGVTAADQQLVDGSGLSRRDVVTPTALLTILRRMHAAPDAAPFVSALPVAGVDGSLSGRMRGTAAQNNLRAKTGTMSNIRSLAGYVTTADGENLAFVIMVNNFEGPGPAAVGAIDAIAVRLASFSRLPGPP